jgi:hypothetical protein
LSVLLFHSFNLLFSQNKFVKYVDPFIFYTRNGNWQGFQTNNVDVVIDLKKTISISKVTANFFQDTRGWIIMPKQFVEVSADNKNFTEVYNGNNFLPIVDLKVQTKEIEATFPAVVARYVRIKASIW